MSPRRATSGGLIDRSRSVRFSFDGQDFTGHPGDTLASALLANGVSLFGRSFKYHRPRGVLGAGVDEPNALVTVLRGEAREPNIQATMLEIHDGLEGRQPEPLPVARLRRRRGEPARRQAARRRLLLQDLHGSGVRAAEGHALLDVLRAFHPPRGRSRQGRYRARPVALRAHERLLRRAGGRLGSGRTDGGESGGGRAARA